MIGNLEDTLRSWSKPSSDTEQEKCDNAERMVRDAIAEYEPLDGRQVDVFAQGSYKNNTNVRADSDVDVCVRCRCSIFFGSDAPDFTPQAVGITVPASYTYGQFRSDVENALVAKFGRRGVTAGPKAFDIHQNSYRVDADAVPCWEYQHYYRDGYGAWQHLSGVQLLTTSGESVVNWPEQHYENGTRKNTATGNRFKYLTRVLKRLRNEMEEEGIAAAKPIPSFLIECLVWNVADSEFGNSQYTDDLRNILVSTFTATQYEGNCRQWLEVSGCKYLFGSHQQWTRAEANAFIFAAWDYIGFDRG